MRSRETSTASRRPSAVARSWILASSTALARVMGASGQTINPAALSYSAGLSAPNDVQWEGRAHFFAAAAEAMRRILINNGRRKHAVRHGGGRQRVHLEELEIAANARDD